MNNSLRISGLSSGIDTETTIKKLMDAQSFAKNRLLQKKQKEEWTRDIYRDLNLQIVDFRSVVSDMRLQSTFRQKSVASDDDTKVTATKVGAPTLDSYSISNVSLASAGNQASVKYINALASDSTAIASAFSFTVQGDGGTASTINVSATDTIASVIGSINSVSSTTNVIAAYNASDKSITFTSKTTGTASSVIIGGAPGSNPLNIAAGTINNTTNSFVVSAKEAQTSNPASVRFTNSLADAITAIGTAFSFTVVGDSGTVETINVLATDTINDVLGTINGFTGSTNVAAAYDAAAKSITFTSGTTGSSSSVTLGGVPGANPLNVVTGTIGNTANTFKVSAVSGKDTVAGSVTINGTVHSITSNTFTYDGIKYSLKTGFTSAVNVSSSYDTDAIFNSVKNFVDKYNTLIGTLNSKINEQKYRDYEPLLEEQKEEMSEKSIEQWETKAKSGLIQRDAIISSSLYKMREAISTKLTGSTDAAYNSLASIGITTSSYYRDNGKLIIDENKLIDAIVNRRDVVEELFTKTYTTATPSDTTVTNSTKYQNSGLGNRFYDQLTVTINDILSKAGSSTSTFDDSFLGKSISRLSTSITKEENRLSDVENRYWNQFTAMEKALSRLNSQSAYLTQALGG